MCIDLAQTRGERLVTLQLLDEVVPPPSTQDAALAASALAGVSRASDFASSAAPLPRTYGRYRPRNSIPALRRVLNAATVILAAIVLSSGAALAAEAPNNAITPGALNPAVTQNNIYTTICRRGWTRTVRPPERYTERIKREMLYRSSSPYCDPSARLREYELDHRVPIGVGGSPSDPKNLWDEPRFGGRNATQKDELEEVIHGLVCHHDMTLRQGQAVFLGDWRAGYSRYVHER
jgi:hypothetical protein